MSSPGRPAPGRPVRSIALMNQKGGVGKTTTTVNLAAAFARAGRPTLVVDLDPQAHATLALGVDPGTIETSVYDLLLEPDPDAAAYIRNRTENLDLLPAVTDLAAAETELAGVPDRNRRLEKALAKLGDKYEFILFDCPPSLGLLTLSGLAAAREVIIPMQAHFLALQGVAKLLETVALISKTVNPRLRVTGVVLCMHDSGTTLTKEVVSELESYFEASRQQESPWRFARVLRPAIRRNIKLAEAPSFGQTIFEYAPAASGAEDYAQLAAAMLKDWDAMLARRAGASPEPTRPATEVVVTVAPEPAAEAPAEARP